MADNLLIIGNGFDLQCELSSSFKDYLIWLRKQYDKSFCKIRESPEAQSIFDILSNRRINNSNLFGQLIENHMSNESLYEKENGILFIEAFLYRVSILENNQRWCDVEKIISNIVTEDAFSNSDDYRSPWSKGFLKMTETSPENLTRERDYSDFIAILGNIFNIETRFSNLNEWNFFLLNQVRLFEKRFSFYLDEERKMKLEYIPLSDILLSIIAKVTRIGKNMNILSFNYTNPFDKRNYLEIEHVHGTLPNTSIIGIDSTDIDRVKWYYCLSKTYRKIEYITEDKTRRIKPVLHQQYNKIVFYGHSLNEQDYAYFQALFDNNNIYSRGTLFFLYSIHNLVTPDEVKRNLINQIMFLIDKYGESFDNKKHGKNLLHKMISEGRIVIREISLLD